MAARDPTPHQLFAVLDSVKDATLRESILLWGVIVPVVRDQHGRTIDGHQRARIADELGVGYRVDVRVVESDGEARELALTLNADRRQLPADQRREIAQALRGSGRSVRAIGGALGVGVGTVHRDVDVLRPGMLAGWWPATRRAGGSRMADLCAALPPGPRGGLGQEGEGVMSENEAAILAGAAELVAEGVWFELNADETAACRYPSQSQHGWARAGRLAGLRICDPPPGRGGRRTQGGSH